MTTYLTGSRSYPKRFVHKAVLSDGRPSSHPAEQGTSTIMRLSRWFPTYDISHPSTHLMTSLSLSLSRPPPHPSHVTGAADSKLSNVCGYVSMGSVFFYIYVGCLFLIVKMHTLRLIISCVQSFRTGSPTFICRR